MTRKDFLPFGKPDFGPMEEEAVLRVLRSGWVGMGPETIRFEEELADFIGAPHVVSVNSCTSALFLALRILGIGPGDEVIVPSLTWCSTANAVLFLGATPVFCDVDPRTFCATWETIRPQIGPRTRSVIVVHFGGLAADTAEIRKNLPKTIALVEDAAHALGARHPDGTGVGAQGNLTCFSFYANKNLSTAEGGAIAVHDAATAEHLRHLRLHGLQSNAWKRYQNREIFDAALSELGYKMNYTDLQAAIGRVQLKRQAKFHERRMEIVRRYQERLPSILSEIEWQAGWDRGKHTAHLFVVKLPIERMRRSRDELLLEFRARNIGAAVHYAPLHAMPLYNKHRHCLPLPVTEDLAKKILTLPISATMTTGDADDVLEAFAEIIPESLVSPRQELADLRTP